MPSPQEVLDALNGIKATQEKLDKRLDDLTVKPENGSARNQGPFVRTGESSMSSRGFSYLKALGLLRGFVEPENAKVEYDVSNKLRKHYESWQYRKELTNSIMLPFASQFLCGDEPLAREVGDVVRAGISGYDADEVRRIRAQQWGVQKAMSWIDETQGGALVGPPLMGELIEVLRNNEVLMRAGARTLAMPPTGRITFPRQTAAATAYWVGESSQITGSQPATGDVILQAKKLGVLSKVPNELFRFSSVSVEMFLREDLSRVLALALDKALLENAGSTTTPKGLINYANINSYTASTVGANGNTFTPADVSKMVGTVESQNAVFNAFIMRPLMWAGIVNRRADAVTAGDQAGPFMFNIIRELGTQFNLDRMSVGNLYGYPVYKSTQISNARAKGGASNLTYILGGNFQDYLIALSGAIEFQISTQGDTPFQQDQTWFRGVLYCDGAPRHEASFVLCDTLVEG